MSKSVVSRFAHVPIQHDAHAVRKFADAAAASEEFAATYDAIAIARTHAAKAVDLLGRDGTGGRAGRRSIFASGGADRRSSMAVAADDTIGAVLALRDRLQDLRRSMPNGGPETIQTFKGDLARLSDEEIGWIDEAGRVAGPPELRTRSAVGTQVRALELLEQGTLPRNYRGSEARELHSALVEAPRVIDEIESTVRVAQARMQFGAGAINGGGLAPSSWRGRPADDVIDVAGQVGIHLSSAKRSPISWGANLRPCEWQRYEELPEVVASAVLAAEGIPVARAEVIDRARRSLAAARADAEATLRATDPELRDTKRFDLEVERSILHQLGVTRNISAWQFNNPGPVRVRATLARFDRLDSELAAEPEQVLRASLPVLDHATVVAGRLSRHAS